MDGRFLLLLAAALLARADISWRSLPPLPQPLGGQFVGLIQDDLVVAGGSFWNRPPWDGGVKSWADTIYVLRPDAKQWRPAGRLPQPLAYGASLDLPDGMILFGGQSASGFSKAVLHLTIENGTLRTRRLADLPAPRAMMNAVAAGGVVYLAGGQLAATPAKASRDFLAIPIADLLAGASGWRELPAWDGPPRFFAEAASCGDSVYLAGGSDLVPGPGADSVRSFLRDAHRYSPATGWQRLPDLPRAAQAGVAACVEGRFHVFGGSDGTLSEELRDKHPGFRRDVLAFDGHTLGWNEAGRMPASLVTTGLALWRGEYIIAGGEDRPGHRSATVLAARIQSRRVPK